MEVETATPASAGRIGNARANSNYECDSPLYIGHGNMNLGHRFHYETRNVSIGSLNVTHNTYYISLPLNSADRSSQVVHYSGCQCQVNREARVDHVGTLAAVLFLLLCMSSTKAMQLYDGLEYAAFSVQVFTSGRSGETTPLPVRGTSDGNYRSLDYHGKTIMVVSGG